MDALVLAGGIPREGDPLYEYTQGDPKALLVIAGKPMAQWVLDALSDCQTIERVVVSGLGPDDGLTCAKPLAFVPNQGSMLDNVRAGTRKILELNPASGRVLVASADIPAITVEMVDWVVNSAKETEHDIYYSVINRTVMEARYPDSRRSFIRLKDVEICGGDLHVFHSALIESKDDIWDRLAGRRKNALRQAALFGFDNLFLILFRLVTIDTAVERASRRLGFRGRVMVSPYAEIGMDVDKPYQLDIMSRELAAKVAP